MARFIVLLVGMFVSTSAFADSFKSGSKFEALELRGSIVVRCVDPMRGSSTRFEACHGYILNPTETDYLISTSNVSAKSVRLIAKHADGGSETKIAAFDQKHQRSKKRINLWLASLTQTPLLEMGVNKIMVEYLDKDKTVTATSQFDVTVEDGGTRSCMAGSYYSGNIVDCESAWLMCGRYFADENYCTY